MADSRSKTGNYEHLLPLGSGSEDEGDDAIGNSVNSRTKPDHPISVPEVDIKDTDKLLLNSDPARNGTAYRFSSRAHRGHEDRFCTPTRGALVFAISLLCLGTGYLAGFFTPYAVEYASSVQKGHKRTANWRTKMSDWGTESCIRLVDADGDGVLDIILGISLGVDVSTMITEASMDEYCRGLGLTSPCAGSVMALRGTDGKVIWKADTYAEIFALNCHSVDVNKDGTYDCIATGRLADMRAINPKNGETLWVADTTYLKRGWNIYSTNAIPDMDYDGVADIVLSHGGDPTIAAEIHERHSGRLMLISGATGKPIGRFLEMPEDKETYISPVVHQRRDGSQYILFGSGGETVGGLFMAISVPDYYRYVHNFPSNHVVPNVKGQYTTWGSKVPNSTGVYELFRSKIKGVMVPPVLADVNNDGVKDILMSCFDGTMVLFDGENLNVMWKAKFRGESYSSPAPGHFNDDDTLDFMVHWSDGAWPYYNTTDTIVIDGRDGTVLWNLTSNKYDVSSDLTLQTTAHDRDVFLFRVQGRNGFDPRQTGAVHGSSGIQRIVTRRSADNGKSEFEDTELTVDNFDASGVLLPESHFRSKRRVIDESYIECEADQTVFLAEFFALDRTVMKAPLKIWERGSEKFYYKLTAKDKQLVQDAIKQYGSNHTMTENEVPWSRGRRSKDDKPFCILVQPDDRTTGAVGDVDGDGQLDVIVNVVSVGILRDEHARYVKMKFDTDIYKINLEEAVANQLHVPINVSIHERMKYLPNENRISTSMFLPTAKQTWAGYMGTYADSVFS